MSTLIYQEQSGDKLKLVAEVDIDDVALAVDALVDEEPKFAGQEFVCFSSDSRVIAEAGDEVIQPRRNITLTGGNSTAPKKRRGRPPKSAQAEEVVDEAPVERSTRKKPGPKPGAKRGPGRPPGTGKRGPGRPPGKRGPGRPPGSKNKPKDGSAAASSGRTRTRVKTNAASAE